jgi:pimeloyl-ACP methyl ester carboxylesterase
MNDVAELKEFVVLHARSQNITDYRGVLDRIRTDEGDGPGSWVREWSAAAAEHEARGRLLDACQHYNMARFPFVADPARQEALNRCVDTFDRWRRTRSDIERVDLDFEEGRVGGWATGLSTSDRLPLVLVMGGIVSIKEQWAPVLESIRRLGMAAVVTEMPGVGENTLPYTPASPRMISGVLDAVRDRADVDETYAMTLSFSGHLALHCALEDRRIRGIVTAGAPIREFFTDTDWQRGVPGITLGTLAHLTGTESGDVVGRLGEWALTTDQLAALDIPVHYVASRRDEIIPASEVGLLRQHVHDLSVLEHDDVHGSPRHVIETRLWCARSVLQMKNSLPLQRAAAGVLLRVLRARRQLSRSPA